MSTANTSRKEKRSSNDLYNTPVEALNALYSTGLLDKFSHFYDPCNGLGAIIKVYNLGWCVGDAAECCGVRENNLSRSLKALNELNRRVHNVKSIT